MTGKREKRSFFNFGYSTILLSFVMLCIVTFSVLSLVTAYSDYKLSKKVADSTMAYYETQELVYKKLAALDDFLWESYQAATNENDYYTLLVEKLQEHGTITDNSYGLVFVFQEPITENNQLEITLHFLYPQEDTDTFYEITEWKSVHTATDVPEDETLNLIQ